MKEKTSKNKGLTTEKPSAESKMRFTQEKASGMETSYSGSFFYQVHEALSKCDSKSAVAMWEMVGQHFKLPPHVLENSSPINENLQQLLFEMFTEDSISAMLLRYIMPLVSTGYYPIDISFARMPPSGFALNTCGFVRVITTRGSKFLVILSKQHESSSVLMTAYLL